MCGIVGFTGSAQAAPILLDGLSKLEYRGYDSAGLAVQNAAGKIEVVKAKGRLRVLSEMTDEGKAVQGCCVAGSMKGGCCVFICALTLYHALGISSSER